MSTLDLDAPISTPIRTASDVSRLINASGARANHARVIVLLALGGVFLDAYDLTTLSYGIEDVTREFGLTPALSGLVSASIMIGTILGSLLGGWFTDKVGRYRVFMADMLCFVVAAIVAGLAPNVEVLIAARFVMGLGVASICRSRWRSWPSSRNSAGAATRRRGSPRGARCGTRRRPCAS